MKSLCRLDVASRIGHFLLTFFVLYVTLSHPNSDLHKSWESKEPSFFILLGLLTLSLFLYLISSLLDPGYLPRPQLTFNPPAKESKYNIKPGDSTAVELESSSSPAPSGTEGIPVKGMRFCRVCSHSQPLRSRHCHQCGRCVRRFDHHCPWLGNCVGERNHRFFWLFLATETALLAWGVWITWSALTVGGDALEWLRANVVLLLCLLLEGVAWCVVSLLFLYHSYLVLTGQTTWEHVSYHRIPYLSALLSNPFDEGCCCNLARFIYMGSPRDWEKVYGDGTSGST